MNLAKRKMKVQWLNVDNDVYVSLAFRYAYHIIARFIVSMSHRELYE